MNKLIGIIVGVLVGYGAGQVVKYIVLLLGAFILSSLGISGSRVDANLGAIAEILGFVALILVLLKIYKLLTNKDSKLKSTKDTSEEVKEA